MSNVGTLAGHVTVGDHAIIGGLGGVHQFCRIGKFAMIGGCSKVVQDIPPFMIGDGNPAETRTINKVGLERHGISDEAIAALRQAYKILFREGLSTSNALEKMKAELPQLPEVQHLIEFATTTERGLAR
jgi:UDP-N-acetylglucosamine acyltransferase